MPKSALNAFGRDGLVSLKNYFTYSLAGLLLSIVVVLLSLGLIGSVSGSGTTGSIGPGVVAAFAILFIIALVAAAILGTYGILSLMFGIRDIRRSTLKHSKDYASISQWLKYLVIVIIVVVSILIMLEIANIASAYSSYGYSYSPSPYVGAIVAVTLVSLVLSAIWAWKLSSLYKLLCADLAKKDLYTAGTLLLVGIVVFIIADVIGLVFSVGSPTGTLTSTVVIFIDLVGMVIYLASLYLGMKGTSAALK